MVVGKILDQVPIIENMLFGCGSLQYYELGIQKEPDSNVMLLSFSPNPFADQQKYLILYTVSSYACVSVLKFYCWVDSRNTNCTKYYKRIIVNWTSLLIFSWRDGIKVSTDFDTF